ncbi:hypothetical protein PBN151_1362 [Paenibacillus sp. NAIST15-1]|nr:hypothetical protein PBN151_1362 [Paenibacillus sp. NAIST15-1]
MSVYIGNDEDLGKAYTYSSLDCRILRIRVQKVNKKKHQCEFCGTEINENDGSAYYSGMNLGKFYCFHSCMKCHNQ